MSPSMGLLCRMSILVYENEEGRRLRLGCSRNQKRNRWGKGGQNPKRERVPHQGRATLHSSGDITMCPDVHQASFRIFNIK